NARTCSSPIPRWRTPPSSASPNEDLGEEVKAVVEVMPGIRPGADLAEELIQFCRAHLAHLKCPRSVDFEEKLPRLPTGKLYKRLLRDRYWGEPKSRIV